MVRLTALGFSWSQDTDAPDFPETEVWVNPDNVTYIDNGEFYWKSGKEPKTFQRTEVHFTNGSLIYVKETPREVAMLLVGGGVRLVEECSKTIETFGKTLRCTLIKGHEGSHAFENVEVKVNA